MAKKNISRIVSGATIVLCFLTLCNLPVGAERHKAKLLTYTISGSVGLGGVKMNGLPEGTIVTDQNGYYSATVTYGWGGTVTPVKEGYNFEPANRAYPKVTSDQQNQDYTPTMIKFTIAGSAGMQGVVMNGLPGNPVTDSTGMYTVTVDYGFTGTATPTKEGYTFNPANRIYSNVVIDTTNQNYTAALITFTISGTAGVEGVVMNGLPGNPITGQGGLYSATVNYGFTASVTPTKEGYSFDPDKRIYSDVASGQTNQNFTAKLVTYNISGSLGLGGVVMKGLPGDPITNATGAYTAVVDHGWSGKVTPTKDGYTFQPPNRNYTNLKTDQGNQNFTPSLITFTISGSAGMQDVVMNGLPGNPVTKADGSYSATVDYGFSATVSPMKEGYTFEPANRIYSNIASEQTSQNYTPALITFTIAGTTNIEGVVMNGLPGNPVTGPGGLYTATVKYGFSGNVTPTKEGYTFEPDKLVYSDVSSAQSNQNYTATIITHTITGNITSRDGPLEGVLISADDGASGTTDEQGKYQVSVDYGYTGKLTPMMEGHTFQPPSRPYTNVTNDQTNQGYTAEVMTFTISGEVTIDGTPVEGVLVTTEPGASTSITNDKGKYTVTVPYGWSGKVTLSKEGYAFDPPSTTYTNVTSNLPDLGELLRDASQRRTTEQTIPIPEPEFKQPTIPTRPITPTQPTIPTQPIAPERMKQPAQVTDFPPEEKVTETTIEPIVSEVPEEPKVSEKKLISNVFVDTDLRQALQDIGTQAGVVVIPDETVVGLVSCEIKNATLEKALEIVLAGTAFITTKTPDYYLISSADPKSASFPAVSETQVIKMNYVKAATAITLLSPALRNYVTADPDAGTVCITAPPVLSKRILSDLQKIDRIPRHVLLEAKIVIMERTDLLDLGIEWTWPKIKAGLFSDSDHVGSHATSQPDVPWGIQVGYATGPTFTTALELKLNLLAKNGEADIVASPQVLAQDGKEAEIKVVTEEYYSMLLEGYWYPRAELEKVETGTILNITPHIGGNNDITLDMATEVSDVAARSSDNFPIVTRRVAKNTVRIHDGGTVALAGLTENRAHLDERRVPGFSRVPLIGGLFRNESRDKTIREVAIFVTAHLIPETKAQLIKTAETKSEKPADPIKVEPVGDEFKRILRESLSRPSR